MKPIIFSEQVASALRAWHLTARKRLKQGQRSGSTTPVHGGTTPVHRLRGHRNYDNINKGRIGGGGVGGGGTSASPGHRDIDDKTKNGRHLGEIESDGEEYNSTKGAQLEVEISSRDFSFRNRQNIAGVSGTKWHKVINVVDKGQVYLWTYDICELIWWSKCCSKY